MAMPDILFAIDESTVFNMSDGITTMANLKQQHQGKNMSN